VLWMIENGKGLFSSEMDIVDPVNKIVAVKRFLILLHMKSFFVPEKVKRINGFPPADFLCPSRFTNRSFKLPVTCIHRDTTSLEMDWNKGISIIRLC